VRRRGLIARFQDHLDEHRALSGPPEREERPCEREPDLLRRLERQGDAVFLDGLVVLARNGENIAEMTPQRRVLRRLRDRLPECIQLVAHGSAFGISNG
jgi:hypothetical protein